MMPPEQYRRIARDADCHLQLTIEDVGVGGGMLEISGRVVRVFRGDAKLAGARMTVGIDRGYGDDADPPPGAPAHVSPERFRIGHILEAYVYDPRTRAQVALDQYHVVDRPTDQPQLRIDVEAPPAAAPRHKLPASFAWTVVVIVVLAIAFALVRGNSS